jgi:glyoxylase-like metal-dependent hydrolase (beta-lactamase superfamily II)
LLCKTCGIQYPQSSAPPARCIVCEDGRQFVPVSGQAWITPQELAIEHFNGFRRVAPDLYGFWTMPKFAIGQRAFLVITPAGNVLWDCISFLDDATIAIIRAFGGIGAVALSHPHFYSAMADWGRTFGCPVLVHEADRHWITDPDPCIELWSGETRDLLPGLTLHRIGGHFPGSTVLHWESRQTVLAGDTVLVTWDREHVSFMWSYPNYVPLPAGEVRRIGDRLGALDFDVIYSAFWERGDIRSGAKAAIERSIRRHLNGPLPHPA